MAYGTPRAGDDKLEIIRFRPSRRFRRLADAAGNGFVAQPYHSNWPLTYDDAKPKYYLFSGGTRLVGHSFRAEHADTGRWSANWDVVDPTLASGPLPEWLMV